jgi:hypothetical protein
VAAALEEAIEGRNLLKSVGRFYDSGPARRALCLAGGLLDVTAAQAAGPIAAAGHRQGRHLNVKPEQANALFRLIDQRYNRVSTI